MIKPVRTLVLVGCVLVLITVAVNVGVSVYHAVALQEPMLAGLAIGRAVLSTAALCVLLLALQRLQLAFEAEHEEREFMREWVLRATVRGPRDPRNAKRPEQGAAAPEGTTTP